jgi:hypothetical protein
LGWGVDARKGADGIDCAQSLKPISDIQRFNASVTNLIGQLLMPRHEGVRTAIISSSTNPTSGYLLLEVDRSERRPHRSEAKGGKGYYKRIGDSFFEMEHYDIEDAFNRMHVPSLSFAWRIDRTTTYGRSGEGGFDADITLQLRNNSTRTAKFPCLYIRRPQGVNLKSSGGYISPLQFRVRTEGEWTYFIGGADHVINPETRSSIAVIAVEIRPRFAPGPMDTINGNYYESFVIAFDCKYGCEDSRIKEETVTLKGEELLNGLP